MNIDIRTLIIIICIATVFELIAIFIQYKINKVYSGIGWWLLGFTSLAVAYGLLFFRGFITSQLISIILANLLILIGKTFIYIGIARFFNKKENLKIIISIFTIFLPFYFYYTYINSNINIRTSIVFTAYAIITLMISQILYRNKTKSIRASINLNVSLFFILGSFFLFRAFLALTVNPINTLFTPTIVQTSTFLILFSEGFLMTFGLIILVNHRLNSENRENQENLELIFNTSPDAVSITRMTDGKYIKVNEGFNAIIGFSREEIIGKTNSDIKIWQNNEDRQKLFKTLSSEGFCENFEALFQDKYGKQMVGLMSAKVINLNDIQHIISVTRDITDRKQNEDRIKALLSEKETILREVHHRIKNNMNTINSLIAIQAESLTDSSAISALKDAGSRVQSMMVLYDKLYQSSDFEKISLADYLPDLIDEIILNFPNNDSVKVEKHIEDFILDAKKLHPLGIIINELLTNIMKYAFTNKQEGLIVISAAIKDGTASVIIQDNGNGIPDSINFENSTGFGLILVGELTKQLEGNIKIERSKLTKIILEFKI